jgi:hypothetical protein
MFYCDWEVLRVIRGLEKGGGCHIAGQLRLGKNEEKEGFGIDMWAFIYVYDSHKWDFMGESQQRALANERSTRLIARRHRKLLNPWP